MSNLKKESHATPHDALFKRVFGQVEKAQAFLSESLKESIDFKSLQIEPGEYINRKLGDTSSDLLYSAKFKNSENSLYFYFLFEHKSTVDRGLPQQLLGYMNRIWKKLDRKINLPVIMPILFYHGTEKWGDTPGCCGFCRGTSGCKCRVCFRCSGTWVPVRRRSP